MGKHKPTPPAMREAALRLQAERLAQDAAAWGYVVRIEWPLSGSPTIRVIPSRQPAHRADEAAGWDIARGA